jgi:thioredoxin-dependent peroxiredoxin
MVETVSVKRWWKKYEDDTHALPAVVPSVVFKTRVRDDSIEGPNPYRWEDKTSFDYFGGKRVILFSLPGAFTPTCSTYQLPGFEKNYEAFKSFGIDEIYCVSVNDAFVMNCWAQQQGVENVKMIPDGSTEFTRGMQMNVQKDNLGFGERSWRYACLIENGKILKWFIEPGMEDNCEDDPYGRTDPAKILEYVEAFYG